MKPPNMRAEVIAMFHDDPHRVFVDGKLTTPSFISRGAAQAYADGINNGYRTPEFPHNKTTRIKTRNST